MSAPTNDYEALRLSLFLALTAPTDDKAVQAAAMAEALAGRLSADDVERASTAALDWARAEMAWFIS